MEKKEAASDGTRGWLLIAGGYSGHLPWPCSERSVLEHDGDLLRCPRWVSHVRHSVTVGA